MPVLPLDKGISFSGTRDRIRTIGKQLDADIERDIAKLPESVADSPDARIQPCRGCERRFGMLRHYDSEADLGRRINLVGRATFTDSPLKFYAYVPRKVTSAAARLDQFLSWSGVPTHEGDDACEFEKTVQGSQLARGRILDWFHIAMKFNAGPCVPCSAAR